MKPGIIFVLILTFGLALTGCYGSDYRDRIENTDHGKEWSYSARESAAARPAPKPSKPDKTRRPQEPTPPSPGLVIQADSAPVPKRTELPKVRKAKEPRARSLTPVASYTEEPDFHLSTFIQKGASRMALKGELMEMFCFYDAAYTSNHSPGAVIGLKSYEVRKFVFVGYQSGVLYVNKIDGTFTPSDPFSTVKPTPVVSQNLIAVKCSEGELVQMGEWTIRIMIAKDSSIVYTQEGILLPVAHKIVGTIDVMKSDFPNFAWLQRND